MCLEGGGGNIDPYLSLPLRCLAILKQLFVLDHDLIHLNGVELKFLLQTLDLLSVFLTLIGEKLAANL